MNRAALLVVSAMCTAFVVVVLACSSNGNGGSGGPVAYSLLYCPNAETLVSTTCTGCVETHCSSEVTAANTGCAPYLQCSCAPGNDAGACPFGPFAATGPEGGLNPCIGDTTGLVGCEVANCAVQCADAGI